MPRYWAASLRVIISLVLIAARSAFVAIKLMVTCILVIAGFYPGLPLTRVFFFNSRMGFTLDPYNFSAAFPLPQKVFLPFVANIIVSFYICKIYFPLAVN